MTNLQTTSGASSRPLCVDLDGTLVRSDLLIESFLLLIRGNPLFLLLVPFWLLDGKAALKAQIARRVVIDPATLPYHEGFVGWLRRQHAAGREIWLCSASDQRLVEVVAGHLSLFAGVLASDGRINLAGHRKAEAIVRRFGERGFDYCGNHRVDLDVWSHAAGAVVVDGKPWLVNAAATRSKLLSSFPPVGGGPAAAFKAIRPHQWVKNLLVFVPLVAAHRVADAVAFADTMFGFIAFCLCASSVYLLNDLLDLPADRAHPRKRNRPFAAGRLSLLTGAMLGAGLLVLAVVVAAWLSPAFLGVLSMYYVLTLAYSFGVKRVVLIDTVALAGLYSLRIVAGGAAASIPLSFWLLLFSVFLFFSLALVKRFAELDASKRAGDLPAQGRGYRIDDLPMLQSFGTASGYVCVLVLALYMNSSAVESLYQRPQAIWFTCVLLLYWLSRVWLKAHRGEMHDDPIVFALKDKLSLAIGALALASLIWAV